MPERNYEKNRYWMYLDDEPSGGSKFKKGDKVIVSGKINITDACRSGKVPTPIDAINKSGIIEIADDELYCVKFYDDSGYSPETKPENITKMPDVNSNALDYIISNLYDFDEKYAENYNNLPEDMKTYYKNILINHIIRQTKVDSDVGIDDLDKKIEKLEKFKKMKIFFFSASFSIQNIIDDIKKQKNEKIKERIEKYSKYADDDFIDESGNKLEINYIEFILDDLEKYNSGDGKEKELIRKFQNRLNEMRDKKDDSSDLNTESDSEGTDDASVENAFVENTIGPDGKRSKKMSKKGSKKMSKK